METGGDALIEEVGGGQGKRDDADDKRKNEGNRDERQSGEEEARMAAHEGLGLVFGEGGMGEHLDGAEAFVGEALGIGGGEVLLLEFEEEVFAVIGEFLHVAAGVGAGEAACEEDFLEIFKGRVWVHVTLLL